MTPNPLLKLRLTYTNLSVASERDVIFGSNSKRDIRQFNVHFKSSEFSILKDNFRFRTV